MSRNHPVTADEDVDVDAPDVRWCDCGTCRGQGDMPPGGDAARGGCRQGGMPPGGAVARGICRPTAQRYGLTGPLQSLPRVLVCLGLCVTLPCRCPLPDPAWDLTALVQLTPIW